MTVLFYVDNTKIKGSLFLNTYYAGLPVLSFLKLANK